MRHLALAFSGAVEQPHFENTSFRARKKIFATMNLNTLKVCVKFTVSQQDVFGLYDPSIIYPVPNKWGAQGWTLIEMQKVQEETLADALQCAYQNITGSLT